MPASSRPGGGYARLSTAEGGDSASGSHDAFGDASCWSRRVSHGWVSPILAVGNAKQLDMADLPRCPQLARVEPLLAAFDAFMGRHRGSRPAERLPLLWMMVRLMGCRKYTAMFLCVGAYHGITLLNPMLLRELIAFVGSSEEERPLWHGLAIALAMGLLTALSAVCMANSVGINNTLGFQQQSILSAALFRKALRLSRQTNSERTVGEVLPRLPPRAAAVPPL